MAIASKSIFPHPHLTPSALKQAFNTPLPQHGESAFNLTGQIGGDAPLSPNGEKYALKLPEMIQKSLKESVQDSNSDSGGRPLTVWTSTLRRTIATARHLPKEYHRLQWKALDELDAGVCDGLTYAQIKERWPEDFKARDEDKFSYRYASYTTWGDGQGKRKPNG